MVSFDTTLYGPASTLFGIERAAHDEGYFVSIASVTSLTFAEGIDKQGNPIKSATSFKSGLPQVYGIFAYRNMQNGLSWSPTWLLPCTAWRHGMGRPTSPFAGRILLKPQSC